MGRMIGTYVVLLWLAACGGGGGSGGSGAGVDPRLARLDIYEAQKLRVLGDPGAGVMGMAVTEAMDVPTGGVVGYTGAATIRVQSATPVILYGDATVSVDFDTTSATGQMDNFFGTTVGGAVANYGGVITLSGTETAQDLTLDYAGALTAGGDSLAFDGTLQGMFLGPTAEALTASDLQATVISGGTASDATIVVVTEAVTPP